LNTHSDKNRKKRFFNFLFRSFSTLFTPKHPKMAQNSQKRKVGMI
jgi:hypothetical protein